MSEYARHVALREPTIRNVIGFVDGLSIPVPVQCSDDEEEQAKMYNGYQMQQCICLCSQRKDSLCLY